MQTEKCEYEKTSDIYVTENFHIMILMLSQKHVLVMGHF